MAQQSSIEWTDATWNPVRGCKKISAGCKNCYAATFAERWRGIPDHPYEFGFDLRLVPEKLCEPLRWTKSKVVFVNSMSDLFQDEIPDTYIKKVFDVMILADWHIFQVLTKRPERMSKFIIKYFPNLHEHGHIWIGVSVENKKHGLPRIPTLVHTPAAVRFLSVEPLLEDLGHFDLKEIDWVIVGGESGRRARPMQSDWVFSIKALCQQESIPFFFKQWGGVNKKKTGRVLGGKVYNEMPKKSTTLPPPQLKRMEKLKMISA